MEALIAKVNFILSKLYVPADKQMHFLSGIICAVILTPIIGWYSVVVVSLIATAKELYDDLHKDIHTPDVWDLVATILGGVLGYELISLL